eukprot:3052796-Pleurochrysis_carterae.AAC.1
MPASDKESRRLRRAEVERSERALKVGAGRRSRRGRYGVDRSVGIGHVRACMGGLDRPRVHVCACIGGLDRPRDSNGECHRCRMRWRLRERRVRRCPE